MASKFMNRRVKLALVVAVVIVVAAVAGVAHAHFLFGFFDG